MRTTYIAIGVLLLFLTYMAGYLPVQELITSTKTINAAGQTWTVDAPFGKFGKICDVGYTRTIFVQPETTDTSTTSQLHITSTMPNSGEYCSGAYTSTIKISLDSIDLRDYQKIIIHRKATANAGGDRYPSLKYTFMGDTYTKNIITPGTNNAGSGSIAFNDVQINNENGAITIISDEGRKTIISPTNPVHFTSSITVDCGDRYCQKQTIDYQITGIELTKGTTNPITNTQNIIQRIINWIRGLFT